MTDHYAAAERLLSDARLDREWTDDGRHVREVLAAAQVHATLATVQRHEFEKAAFTDTRTIPWPPSYGLLKRVATALHDVSCSAHDVETHRVAWMDDARDVLDAIGGAGDEQS